MVEGISTKAIPGAMLIGLSVTTHNFAGHKVIGSVQAIYKRGGKEVTGDVHGHRHGKPVVLVAKTGYAVGGIIAIGGARLDGLQVVFMRQKGHDLDPAKSYQSDWVGGKGGEKGTQLGCEAIRRRWQRQGPGHAVRGVPEGTRIRRPGEEREYR